MVAAVLMRVFVKWQRGGDAGTVELERDDTLELVRQKVAEATGVHPTLQLLVFSGAELREGDEKTVRDYEIGIDDELRLSARPGPRAVNLNVGGTGYTTTLATLRKVEGSQLDLMFDGLAHEYVDEAEGGLPEGVPRATSTILVPRAPDGSFVIDRHGGLFQYVLDYLRDYQPPEPEPDAQQQEQAEMRRGGGGASAISLPASPELVRQLAAEARFFGLPELNEACNRGRVFSLGSFAATVDGGFTARDVARLTDAELTELLQEKRVNVMLAKRIRAEVYKERERARAEEEAEAARIAGLEAEERTREALRLGLRKHGAELSDAGLRALIASGRTDLGVVCQLDAAAAQGLGLNAADAQVVGGLHLHERQFVFERVSG
eukprot:COSAG06_NODE_13022_length_1301_cov_2.490017_1_plen_377_part_10